MKSKIAHQVIHCENKDNIWSSISCPDNKDPIALAESLAELKHINKIYIGTYDSTPQDETIQWIKGGHNDRK